MTLHTTLSQIEFVKDSTRQLTADVRTPEFLADWAKIDFTDDLLTVMRSIGNLKESGILNFVNLRKKGSLEVLV